MNELPINKEPATRTPASQVVGILLAERERLLHEIQRIDRFLAQEGCQPDQTNLPMPVPLPVVSSPRNVFSKVQAMKKALEVATTPLTPRELVLEMNRLGYTFTSTQPTNTLNPFLYGAKKVDFLKKFGRGYILVGREKDFEQVADVAMPPLTEGATSS